MKPLNFIISVLFIFFMSSIYSQTKYDRGFEKGFQNGYCYEKYGCIPPISPIAPIPKVGESSDSYNDGYNRGFQRGVSAQKNNNTTTKKSSSVSNISTSEFKSISYNEMLSVPMALQKRYDQNQKYLYAMENWILELKVEIREKKFLDRLEDEFRILEYLEDKDLARSTKYLRDTEKNIREIISDYKIHLKQNSKKKEINRYKNGRKEVFTYSPILDSPSNGSKKIGEAVNNAVYIIEHINGTKYYKVTSGNITGYMSDWHFK